MGEDPSDGEIRLAIESCFCMLVLERSGATSVKTDHRRRPRTMIPGRSDKSVEYKWCNVSAGLEESRLRWIVGHTPLANYQERLKALVGERLLDHPYLRSLVD